MTTGCTIRIALADDHTIVREGLKALLLRESAFELVGEASDGREAIELVETLKPDVLLLDLRMPCLHGLDVLRHLRGQKKTRVIVLSMHSDEPYVLEAIKHGVAGYLLKDSAPLELMHAIRSAFSGEEYISEDLRQKVLNAGIKRLAKSAAHPQITNREQLVLELAAEGHPNSEIAQRLYISRRTVEAHRASVMKKLGLRNQTDIVLYAVRHNIIAP